MSTEINLDQIKTDLVKLDSELSPSELHGNLCGALCAKGDMNIHDWLTLTFFSENDKEGEFSKAVNSRELLLSAIAESFKPFFISTAAALADNSLNFYPLLPDDESESIRLAAIAQWAQGFLMGLSLAGVKDFSAYAGEVNEFVEAMASITAVGDYELAGDDSDEEAIIEFIEFIRIGVLLLNEEMNPVRVPIDIPDSSSIH
ncbi:MAG: YecA family protein [Gammaproteobacteria bacterium]|nr:YecA family protein [Gammaproteobacteria bacterium]